MKKKVVSLEVELNRLQIEKTFQGQKIKLSYQIKAEAIKKQLQGKDQIQDTVREMWPQDKDEAKGMASKPLVRIPQV